jgi:alpha-ketoglutaric semialdehyde dehydrogenase
MAARASGTHEPYNHIGGRWRRGADPKASFENRNPATGELLGRYPESTEKDVDDAVASARKGYQEWRRVPVAKRGEILLKAMQLLKKRKEDMARAMTREMGKVLAETRGDVQEAIDTAFYYAGEGRRFYGQTTTSELPDKFAMTVRMPVGVCVLITPWNFPMAIPSWKIFPALLCGNAVILKPASYTPESARQLVQVLLDAGVPPLALNLLYGKGATTGNWLLRHQGVDLASFTGSSEVGSSVAQRCARTYKKCSLELGGKNAQVVMEDAELELALEGALWGAFGTTGQRCTATSRIIVHKKVYNMFRDALVARVRKIRVGNGLDQAVQMGPLVSDSQKEMVLNYIRLGENQDGARLITGGHALAKGAFARGHFVQPTIFEGAPDMRIAQEEIFGPVVTLLKAKSFDEALGVLNNTHYGLSGSIYTKDIRRMMRAVSDMETGITYINAPTIGAEVHLPFGGIKRTGNGHREAGIAALDIFAEWKAVYVDYSGQLQRAQIDNRKLEED